MAVRGADPSVMEADAWRRFLRSETELIERALEHALPRSDEEPRRLHRAMRYSVFPGGKRIRPALVLLGARTVGRRPKAAAGIGAAIELIHTFSLIHDDLPCMDDDDYRRGKPSTHRKFGEALAVLAGDALQVLAFQVLSELDLPLDRRHAVLTEVTRAVGPRGVIGGQVDDLESEGRRISEARLRVMHARKTGALLTAAIVSGGLAAGAGRAEREALARFGREFGLLFQIVDDVMNEFGSYEALGRRRGGDRTHRKATYLSVLGPDRTRERLHRQVIAARASVFGPPRLRPVFRGLIRSVVGRLPGEWAGPALATDGAGARG